MDKKCRTCKYWAELTERETMTDAGINIRSGRCLVDLKPADWYGEGRLREQVTPEFYTCSKWTQAEN